MEQIAILLVFTLVLIGWGLSTLAVDRWHEAEEARWEGD